MPKLLQSVAVSNEDESEENDTWNFAESQKEVFGQILQKGENEIESIEEKLAVTFSFSENAGTS